MVSPINEHKTTVYISITEGKRKHKGKRKCIHKTFYGMSPEDATEAAIEGILQKFPLAMVPVELPAGMTNRD